MTVYGIIPARSGSKGLPNKNVKLLNGRPLISYSISFAKHIGLDRVFCSTDSADYADIAIKYGAEVPFLRTNSAATSTAMEQDILADLYECFDSHGIAQPDLIVWLRPTFVFRHSEHVKQCIQSLLDNPQLSAARTVCETESRLYEINDSILLPSFDDSGKSMVRRQDVGVRYKVFSTDVIRASDRRVSDDFLGHNVAAIETSKLCGLDIDDIFDFHLVEAVLASKADMVSSSIDDRYLHFTS